MKLKQLVAKLIDLELDEGDTDVWVRDGSGQLGPLTSIDTTVGKHVTYIELNPGGTTNEAEDTLRHGSPDPRLDWV